MVAARLGILFERNLIRRDDFGRGDVAAMLAGSLTIASSFIRPRPPPALPVMLRDAHCKRPIVDREVQRLELVADALAQRRRLGPMAPVDTGRGGARPSTGRLLCAVFEGRRRPAS
jgi:hypothetical protein